MLLVLRDCVNPDLDNPEKESDCDICRRPSGLDRRPLPMPVMGRLGRRAPTPRATRSEWKADELGVNVMGVLLASAVVGRNAAHLKRAGGAET